MKIVKKQTCNALDGTRSKWKKRLSHWSHAREKAGVAKKRRKRMQLSERDASMPGFEEWSKIMRF